MTTTNFLLASPFSVLLLVSLSLFLSSVASSTTTSSRPSLPNKWHRLGLGRTIHLFSPNVTSHSHLFVLTSLGTVAHLDIHSSSIHWRLAPPLFSQNIHPTAAATLGDDVPSLLLVLMSDNMLRAVDPLKQSIIWQVPACQLGVIQRAGIVPITTCEGITQSLSATTGTVMAATGSTDSTDDSPPFMPADRLGSDNKQLRWLLNRVDGGQYALTSEIDGALRLMRLEQVNEKRTEREIWRREDGIAHVTAGSIFFLNDNDKTNDDDNTEDISEKNDSSERKSKVTNNMLSDNAIVVILSELGTLYALTDASTVKWKLSVSGQCNLLESGGLSIPDHAVLVCLHDLEKEDSQTATEVRVVRIRDGHTTFSETKKKFKAVKASVESCCRENADKSVCIAAINSGGHEQWFSSCNFVFNHDQATILNSDDNLSHNAKQQEQQPAISDRGWLVYSVGGHDIQGIRNGKSSWKVAMPNAAKIVSVTSKQHYAPVSKLRPAPIRVTTNRDLLYKYVDEDVLLVLAHDTNAAELYAMIIDGRTGALHDVRAHRTVATIPAACAVGGDHWFVYSFWNVAMLQQEVHILDMYHDAEAGSNANGKRAIGVNAWVGETVRAAVRVLFGREVMSALGIPDPDFTIPCVKESQIEIDIAINNSVTTSASEKELPESSKTTIDNRTNFEDSMRCSSPYQQRWHRQQQYYQQQQQRQLHEQQHQPRHQRVTRRKPVFFRSSMLLIQRVTSLSVTETIHGITEPAVILTLESGQVTLVPKFLLDALRPFAPSKKEQSSSRNMPPMSLPRYKPVLAVESSSRESTYFAGGFHMPGGVKKIAVTPCRVRESCSIMAVFGMDIIFGSVQPVGSFDTLPRDEFAYSAVVGMLLILVTGVVYTNRMKARVGLNKAWK